ncbi:DUF2254 domain-containing protein [Roseobacter sp. A03A-229]
MKYGAMLLKLAQDIRASYWFIPATLVLFALALAHASEWLDHNTDLVPFSLPSTLLDTQVDGARNTLSTIATSVIGVTGVMFSMTIVAVSFAAGNYGPRLIGNFMRDRGNQISLGILIATFVYTLSILRAVQDPSDSAGVEAFVPQYSMLLAMLGSVLAVFTMIYFVHHVPETINVSNITANLGRRLETEIMTLIDAQKDLQDETEPDAPDRAPDREITHTTAGYVQTLNYPLIEDLMQNNGWRLRLEKVPGDFITRYTTIVQVWSDQELTEDDICALRNCYAIGVSRTEHQNILFLVDELVEMLARALSPGVNDPFTAINCLNWMHNALKTAQSHGQGLGENGARTYRCGPKLTYDVLFKRSCLASEPYCKSDHLALEHYKNTVRDLSETSRDTT